MASTCFEDEILNSKNLKVEWIQVLSGFNSTFEPIVILELQKRCSHFYQDCTLFLLFGEH